MLPIIAFALLAPSDKIEGPRLEVLLQSGKSFEITMDAKNTPQTTKRIVELVRIKFYDGQRFHRVEDWVVQWGAPASKNKDLKDPEVGGGGSGRQLPFEAGKLPFLEGTVGIASTGRQVGGDSQLFIVKRDSEFLNGSYSACGRVTKGLNVVKSVKVGDRIKAMRVLTEQKRPGRKPAGR
ncbi:MAG: peptidylprolyl isomerase [Fimbriimonadales bacterium]|nr:peptidylprolyl isomerase [Fimbriimonadales bacterium]